MDPAIWTCGICNTKGKLSPPVTVAIVWLPGLERPYPLEPGDAEYQVCLACSALHRFVSAAVLNNPTTRAAGNWTRAIVIFDTGEGYDVTREPAATQAKARA